MFDVTEISRDPPTERPVVTVGEYDGVHRGHQRAIRQLRDRADRTGAPVGVVTYEAVGAGAAGPRRLTSLDHRLELLADTNLVDVVWVVRPDLGPPPAGPAAFELFVEEVLVERIRARAVALTGDAQTVDGFPDQRSAYQALSRLGERHGFEVFELDAALAEDGAPPTGGSTAEVARLLVEGRVGEAARLLGRPHEMRGVVEPGDQRGRLLGFPTANLAIPSTLVVPAEGVYAGRFLADDGIWRPAAVSLGRRPTFYQEGHELLEAYVIDFDGDLYGQQARVQFVEFLRGQERFESIDELVEQLHGDVVACRGVLGV